MSLQIEMPQLSSDGESATLASWLVDVGDKVEEGDVIAELETDKSTVELEAPATGTITELSVAAGTEDVSPGTVLGRIDPSGDEVAAGSADSAVEDAIDASGTGGDGASADDAGPAEESASADDAGPAEEGAAGDAEGSGSAEASTPGIAPELDLVPTGAGETTATAGRGPTPLARRTAEQSGVDLREVAGTGPRGRVVAADVLRLASEDDPEDRSTGLATGAADPVVADLPAAEPTRTSARAADGPGFEAVRLTAMRKTIARRLTESKQQVPHFYLRARVAMDELIAVRARLNTGLAEEGRPEKLSVNDFIVRAAALALREVPEANVQFAGDAMHHFDRVDVSVAVATEGGLVTPVVHEADRKGLVALSAEIQALAAQAREGTLRPEQYQGGTITVSNLGMYGIETVYPILNPPQACILGIGAAEEQPVVRDGELAIGRIAAFTLAADHRAVDGAVGARLLAALKAALEDPMGMML